jgi:hypothetical protein
MLSNETQVKTLSRRAMLLKTASGQGIDLLNNPADWPIVKKYGLIPTMTSGAGTIPDACNRKDLHDKLEKEFQENIPRAAENGIPNVITLTRAAEIAARGCVVV